MKKTIDLKFKLFILFSVTVVVSNIISAKILWTPFSLLGQPMVLPGSAFVYLLTFMISGFINELWGRDAAKQCVKFGLMSQIMALTLFWLTGLFPASDQSFQAAYQTVLGRNFVFVASDIVAGFTAHIGHVFLFPLLKKIKPQDNEDKPKNSGLINCISTLISQLFDTVVFMTCAFGIGLGFLFTSEGRISLLSMFLGQYAIKIVVCLASIPLFNVLLKEVNSSEETEESEEETKTDEESEEKENDEKPEPEFIPTFLSCYSKATARFEVWSIDHLDRVIRENNKFEPELAEWLNSTIEKFAREDDAKSFARRNNSEGIFPVQCKDCKKYFSQNRRTVLWYKKRDLQAPKRCPSCREERKIQKSVENL